MADIKWAKALSKLEDYVFKIVTPTGTGTGFLISLSGNLCGVATAFHVVEHECDWEQPIKLHHYKSGKTLLLRKPDRVIFPYRKEDLAFILFGQADFKLPSKMLEMIASNKRVRQGVKMGWCGFPNIASSTLCFFAGRVSSFVESTASYLVDGVVIHGVSGGPAFTIHKNLPRLCGVVSAYIANRATGETLPGVCHIRDVAPYQAILSELESMEQAKEKEKEKDKTEVDQAPAQEKQPAPEAGKPAKKKGVKKEAKRKVAKKKAAKKGVKK